MKLVKFQQDWVDELDVYGFRIFTEEEWTAYREFALASGKFELWFGTNEGWDGDLTPQEVINGMTVVDITDDEVTVLTTHFPGGYFGIFPDKECFENQDG